MDKVLDVFDLYIDSDDKKVETFREKLDSRMDVKIETNRPKSEFLWITKMEETIEHLENILKNPKRLIINEEEVVKIEKIKKVTVESIKNLAKNSSFIDKVEDGEVKPSKLLNVFKEETFNTYENRFIYTLIQKMLVIIKKEKDKLLKDKSKDKEHRQFDYIASTKSGKSNVDVQIRLGATTESQGKSDALKDYLERVKELQKKVVGLTLSPTYVELEREHVSIVTPPIKKTNVLLKNVDFQYAVRLWDFLVVEMDSIKKDENPEHKVKEYKERGKLKKYVDDTFLLDYLVLDCIDNPQTTEKHKKEVIEKLIANIVEKTLDVSESFSEEQLKNLVSKQYQIIKYRRTTTNREIQEIFKDHISKYVEEVSRFEFGR